MTSERKWQQCKQFSARLALEMVKTEQKKGRDKTMLQEKTEYWQEVNNE
ncbi:MAG: hypothetical protein IJ298_07365 [Ruminococcus sp.]|nr:hypothetical protein [Ruminococcus sp.]